MRMISLLFIFILTSCNLGKVTDVFEKKSDGQRKVSVAKVQTVKLVDDTIIIQGQKLNAIKNVKVKSGSNNFELVKKIGVSQSENQLIYTSLSLVNLKLGSLVTLLIEEAGAQAQPISVVFQLENNSIDSTKLHHMGAVTGQILQFNGSSWAPGDLNDLVYGGKLTLASTIPPASPANGQYFIVDQTGSYNFLDGLGARTFNAGDWAVYNLARDEWDQVTNTTTVTQFNGRTGVVVPATNDYTWNQIDKSVSDINDITNVDTTGAFNGSVLKYDGSNWVAGVDNVAHPDGQYSTGQGSIIYNADDDANGSGDVRFQIASQDKLILKNDGKIGFGTATPQTFVEMRSDIEAAFSFTGTSGQKRLLLGNQDASGVNNPATITGVDGHLYLGGGDSWTGNGGNLNTSMMIHDNGNVGIGTNLPQTSIHVTGQVTIGGTNALNGAKTGLPFNVNDGSRALWIGPHDNTPSGDYGVIYGEMDVAGGNEIYRMNFVTGDNAQGTTNIDDEIFIGNRNHIDSSKKGITIKNGKVGVGTTTPLRSVHITDNSSTSITSLAIENTDTTNGNNNVISFRTTTTGAGGTDFTEVAAISGDYTQHDHATRSSDLKFYTSNNGALENSMIIKSSGSVGIGTVTPSYNLHVYGDGVNAEAGIIPSHAQGKGTLRIGQSAATGAGFIYDGSPDRFSFIRRENSIDYTVASYKFNSDNFTFNGSVGIGTSAPTQPLELVVDDWKGIQIQHTTSSEADGGLRWTPNNTYSGRRWLMLTNDTPNTVGTGNDGGLMFRTNSGAGQGNTTPRMVINDNGYVGIGTITPSHKLHVIGTAGLSTGTAWTNTSDIRLKDIRGDYEYGLDEIRKLNTVKFNYKKDNELDLPSDKEIIGFIAQDVQQIIPEAVIEREDGFLELNVDPIHWAGINAIQDLDKNQSMFKLMQKGIETRVSQLEREVASLKNRLKVIETKLGL